MTTYYVDDDGDNTTHTTLLTASTTLTNLFSSHVIASGDIILIRSTHVEGSVTQMNLDDTSSGVLPYYMIGIDGSENYESMETGGGTIDCTANILLSDCTYCYGITFKSGAQIRASNTASVNSRFDDCLMWQTGNSLFYAGCSNGSVDYRNCRITLTGSGSSTYVWCGQSANEVLFRGCTFSMSTSTASFVFRLSGSDRTSLIVEDSDLSDVAGAKLLDAASFSYAGYARFSRCTLKSGFTHASFPGGNMSNKYLVEDCTDGVITVPEFGITQMESRLGTITHETTSVRTGGASNHGVTYSHKFVTDAVAEEIYHPLEGPPMVIRVDSGSQTLTIHFAGAVDMNDDDLWVEVSSPSELASETSQYLWQSTRLEVLATPAATNLVRDTGAVWGGADTGSDGSTGQQKIDISINPAQAGKVVVRAYLAKPSTTHYVCPKIEVA